MRVTLHRVIVGVLESLVFLLITGLKETEGLLMTKSSPVVEESRPIHVVGGTKLSSGGMEVGVRN